MNYVTLVRICTVCAIVALVAPVLVYATTYEDDLAGGSVATDFDGRNDTLFVTTQGTSTMNGTKAKAIAIDTATGEVVWSHHRYERYFDVEPLSNDTILFLGAAGPHGDNMWANVVNWHTGQLDHRFRVPADTHDIDHMGGDRYAIADKEHDRVYVYDAGTDEVVWQYRFGDRFPGDAGGPPEDYTHLNDVDVVDNGSFLVSPRNFDRVMLLNRSEKRVHWTLGAEDDYDVLHEQHNPSLISRNPPVVLVADSENDRIIEYRKNGSEWEQVWAYRGELTWPRDADRLPNGNTLVVDSNGQRVLEVTPGREVAWELRVTKNSYDADLLSIGEEPAGPSMSRFRSEFSSPEAQAGEVSSVVASLAYLVELLQWVVPWNIRFADLRNLLMAVVLFAFLSGSEARRWRAGRDRSRLIRWFDRRGLTAGIGILALGIGGYLLVAPDVHRSSRWLWHGVGLLTLGIGALSTYDGMLGRSRRESDGVADGWVRPAIGAVFVIAAVVMAVTGWLGINVAVATVFWLETVRRVPATNVENDRWVKRAYAVVRYGSRLGAVVPAAVLVYLSTGRYYETVYLGLSALLVCTTVVPSGRSPNRLRRATSELDLRSYALGGVRAVFAGIGVVATVGLVYASLQPTTLWLTYVGLAVALVRTVGLLVVSTDGGS